MENLTLSCALGMWQQLNPLRKARRNMRLTMQGLAQAAGLATSTVHRIEVDGGSTTLKTLMTLDSACKLGGELTKELADWLVSKPTAATAEEYIEEVMDDDRLAEAFADTVAMPELRSDEGDDRSPGS